jgi:nucleotide-binding universal stress UspA family protein
MSDTTGWDGPSILVVGFDGSSASRHALAYAAGMARREMSDLVVVEVNPSGSEGSSMTGGALRPRQAEAGSVTTEVAYELEELLPGRWWVELSQGDPAVELKRLSDEVRSDAIVIGRSHGCMHEPLGSVARWLIRHAHQPVIVVP